MTPLVVTLEVVIAIAIMTIGAIQIQTHLVYGQNESSPLSQIYENETANVRIQFPANWITETKNLNSGELVRIFPMEFIAERYPTVGFEIRVRQPADINLRQMAEGFEGAFQANPDVRVINSTRNATLFNGTVPAFLLNYYDFSGLPETKEMSIGTVLNNTNTAYLLRYYAEPENFDKYLPQAQKMIDSFQLLNKTSDNNNMPMRLSPSHSVV